MNQIGVLFSISWAGYDDNRPSGWPKTLAEMFMPGLSTQTPPEIANFPRSLGGGYMITISFIHPPIKQLPPASLASVRQKRLRRRLENKAPLFVDQFMQQEMSKNPAYFSGITDEELAAARDAAIKNESDHYQRLLAQAGKLIIYANEPAECTQRAAELFAETAEIRARLKRRNE